jgi:hypothetical protein
LPAIWNNFVPLGYVLSHGNKNGKEIESPSNSSAIYQSTSFDGSSDFVNSQPYTIVHYCGASIKSDLVHQHRWFAEVLPTLASAHRSPETGAVVRSSPLFWAAAEAAVGILVVINNINDAVAVTVEVTMDRRDRIGCCSWLFRWLSFPVVDVINGVWYL